MDALYRVCEWQWSNPQKFRALLNDDEPTAWVSRRHRFEVFGEGEVTDDYDDDVGLPVRSVSNQSGGTRMKTVTGYSTVSIG